MLEIKNVSLQVSDNERPLLFEVSAEYPLAHFGAIIGPSGCGKTTLLKLIAGIAPGEEEGEVFWKDRNLEEDDFSPGEIAYVPQFSIAHEELTVRECVTYALRLRVRRSDCADFTAAVDAILTEVDLLDLESRSVKILSGGQRRRLALAMELTSKPDILLCDEVTSGLDPSSEDDIVRLLHGLSRKENRLILSVTHSLEHIDLYDSILVLFQGIVTYHGPAKFLAHYFGVNHPNEVYARLELRTPEEWGASWIKHSGALKEAAKPKRSRKKAPEKLTSTTENEDESGEKTSSLPGPISQFVTLLSRRLLVFSRSRQQLLLQVGLIFGFPLLVAIFAWNGLPAVKNLSMGLDLNLLQQLNEARDFLIQSSKVGSLVSGIVMFQVILLTLMGANNSGREIAAERLIFEKEKLSGLSPLSYVASKTAFLGFMILAQSLWMGFFVHQVCGFPGNFEAQLFLLVLVNAAMSSICLAVSSLMRSPEQASLVSIYLVGFQLPLSGAVLALPELLGSIVRPFVSAYWSWSGILQTLKAERYYDIVQTVVQSPLSSFSLCVWILLAHIAAGLFITCLGCERRHIA
ncbi:MAG: ATP-binding cassette domain-containing protein [Spartobacteria bacterium]|nr:ATP-binding cassette domain-containing protein [Spartobacteria bacterium]